MTKKILIGVAWPYVNGDLHVGHLAGYLLPADICARYNRLIGNDVLMVSGSDCHGTPITVEADKKKKSPKEIVEEYHAKDTYLFKDVLKLSYDLYTRTDTENHIKVVQDFFVKFVEEGLIFVDSTEQYYSPADNKFLPDRYVIGTCPNCGYADARSDQCDNCGKVLNQGELINPRSNLTGAPVELKKTQHYFLDWPKLQPKIQQYVDATASAWKPWVEQETKGWLAEGLKPRAITRDIDWGVPVPVDRLPKEFVIEGVENKRLYVWFDAVIGYFSASKLWAEQNNTDWKPFWYGNDLYHYYFMGKDNLIFHTIFWPGKLIAYDPALHLPDLVSINMFLNLDGQKFSKSRGITIDTRKFVEKYGNDRVRFYLTYIMPEHRDASFNWNDFKEKVNGVLVANLGNFVHRSLSLAKSAPMADVKKAPLWDETTNEVRSAFEKARGFLDKCEFRNYLDVILSLSSYGNSLVDREKLWELKKTDISRFTEVIKQLYLVVLALGVLMQPLMFDASSKLFATLGLPANVTWPDCGKEDKCLAGELVKITLASDFTPLFAKVEETGIE